RSSGQMPARSAGRPPSGQGRRKLPRPCSRGLSCPNSSMSNPSRLSRPTGTAGPVRDPAHGRPGPPPAPIVPWLARPGVRRALAELAVALVAFAVGMLLYPVTTDIYTSRAQARLRRDFAARVVQEQAPQPVPAPAAPAPTVVGPGQVVALIRIPKLNLDTVMVEGIDPATLREGPGH